MVWTADDLVVALIQESGSALLPCPPGDLTPRTRPLNRALSSWRADFGDECGPETGFWPIKGGRLAAAAFPAKVVSLVVSDVPGDEACAGRLWPDGPRFHHPAAAR